MLSHLKKKKEWESKYVIFVDEELVLDFRMYLDFSKLT